MRSACLLLLASAAAWSGSLDSDFSRPPLEARPRAFWVWLHTHISKSRITYEFEQMKKQGIGGVLQWDPGAGPSEYGTHAVPLPPGPAWMSPQWRDALLYAFREADRLGLEVTLTLMPGANCGGPWITPAMSAQKIVWGVTRAEGPRRYSQVLPLPQGVVKDQQDRPLYYRDIAVFAAELSRLGHGRPSREISDVEPLADTADIPLGNPWTDVTRFLDSSGRLNWDIPAGQYRFLRMGHTATGQSADYFATGQKALYADHLSRKAVEFNFRAMFDRLFGKGPLPKSLKGIHCDSFEVSGTDWTEQIVAEFRRRRGYDPVPWLPVLESGNIDTRALSARFRQDFDRTRSDLFFDNHYRLLADLAHARGLLWQTEAGGPREISTDSLQMLGTNDIPVGEFWMECATHRVTPEERYYVKGPASAAHIYGRQFVAAEAFTSIGNHWSEDPWSLKPVADEAFLQGVNRMILHTFDHSPEEFGKPGAVYFAGTHINPNITWWDQSHAWFDYLARCSYMLSRGLFVADVLLFNGEQVPNYVQMRHVDPRLGPGYDYDVVNAEALLTRASAKDGRIVFPDGMSYRVLVLPGHQPMSIEVLRKIGELVGAGATVIGLPPVESIGQADYRNRDAAVKRLAAEIWAGGKVIRRRSIREVLRSRNTPPDFIAADGLDYIHRRDGDTDLYFIVNKENRERQSAVRFRVLGKIPELWDPATGARRLLPVYRTGETHTEVPLHLAARESVFVVFRQAGLRDPVAMVEPAAEVRITDSGELRLRAPGGCYHLASRTGRAVNVTVAPVPEPLTINGPWTVRFTPGWGAPDMAYFPQLVTWSSRAEPGIRYYSGAATYSVTFQAPTAASNTVAELDLGTLHNLAEVSLNGHNLGVLWKPPFRTDITGLLNPGVNRLEVKVVNLWPNRMIGDASLPAGRRFTRTNMLRYTANSPLLPSGLLGPVRIVSTREVSVRW
ncbi:MAG: hypothetical protein IT160_07280 [Bryobacterales bacterium]|nr:hypothetical protein [Bryobacterales bacterium]